MKPGMANEFRRQTTILARREAVFELTVPRIWYAFNIIMTTGIVVCFTYIYIIHFSRYKVKEGQVLPQGCIRRFVLQINFNNFLLPKVARCFYPWRKSRTIIHIYWDKLHVSIKQRSQRGDAMCWTAHTTRLGRSYVHELSLCICIFLFSIVEVMLWGGVGAGVDVYRPSIPTCTYTTHTWICLHLQLHLHTNHVYYDTHLHHHTHH